jgi:hypothetical protein
LHEVGEREWTVGAGAVGEAVAAGGDDLAQGVPYGLEVVQLLLYLGQLAQRALLQVGRGMAAPASVETLGHLIETR